MLEELLIFLAISAITLIAIVFSGRYFQRAAIRTAEQAATNNVPSARNEHGRTNLPPDVLGGRIDSRTGKLERP